MPWQTVCPQNRGRICVDQIDTPEARQYCDIRGAAIFNITRHVLFKVRLENGYSMHQENSHGSVDPQSSTNRFASLVVIIVSITLGAPIYENVKNSLAPSLGNWPAFAVGILGAIAVTFPAIIAVSWISKRERNGKTIDLSMMFYRPAILPLWMFFVAASKNISEFAEFLPWVYLVLVLVLLAVVVSFQRRRGAAWAWRIAVPIGVLIGLVALPLAGFCTWVIAPDQMHPK